MIHGNQNPIFGILQTILILVLGFLFVFKFSDIRTKTTHFECPQCSSAFKLSRLQFAFALKRNFYERLVTCPVCGYRDWMPIINDPN